MRRATLLFVLGVLGSASAIVAACVGHDPDLESSADAGFESGTPTPDGTAEDAAVVDAYAIPDAAPLGECVQPSAASTVLAHSEYGFRDAQGGCGWSYRFAAPSTIQLSKEMPLLVALDGGDAWFAESGKVAQLTRAGGHPSDVAAVIRRWVSVYGGDIRIRGTVNVPGSGDAADRDGVTFAILRNDAVIESTDVRGSVVSIDRQLSIAIGDRIDFVLTMRNTPTFDFTTYALEIARD